MDLTSPFPQPPAAFTDDPADPSRPSPAAELHTFVNSGRFITSAAVRIVGAALVLSAILTLCMGLSTASLSDDLVETASRSKNLSPMAAEGTSAVKNQISALLLRSAVLNALITAAVVRLARPQAAALAPHQPQAGVAQPPYQPVPQGRA